MKNSSFRVQRPEQSSGFLLWQVTTIWQRKIKIVLEKLKLNQSCFAILASLLWFKEQNEETTQTILINHTKLDKMTVSKSMKILENNSLIKRIENVKDTRAKTISLTSQGIDLAKQAIVLVENIDVEFFSNLEDNESEELNKLFFKIIEEKE